MKPVIVFDLNETLLDVSGLDPTFVTMFAQRDGGTLRKEWFRQVVEYFLTSTAIGQYRSFDILAMDALATIAARLGREVTAHDRATLAQAVGTMPAYPDVRPGLALLKERGFTVATLTNSTEASALRVIEHANLRDQFDRVLSADAVQRFKPAREAYEYAATQLNVDIGQMVLVAAHSWDIRGAMAAGCQTAFVGRPGSVMSPGDPRPQWEARDIVETAKQIIGQFAD